MLPRITWDGEVPAGANSDAMAFPEIGAGLVTPSLPVRTDEHREGRPKAMAGALNQYGASGTGYEL